MDFGYLSDVSAIDFRLPPDHPDTRAQLHRNARDVSAAPQVYAGCPLWTYKEWVGTLYPAGARQTDFLYHYARQFNTIEVNTTHYRIPDEKTIARWREAVTPGFKFCPKLPQIISHEKQLKNTTDLTRAFCESVMGLGEHLGISFLQLPPSFGPEQLPGLEHFILNLPENFPLAVEFRHPDWFTDVGVGREVFALLEACNIHTVLTDVALRRDVLHMRLTTPFLFLRFNGYKLHPSDFTRIDAWVRRLKIWFQEGLQRVYFFLHQSHSENIPPLFRYFLEQLYLVCGVDLRDLCKQLPQEVQGELF